MVLGKSEDNIVVMTQIHSRIFLKSEIFLINSKFFRPVKKNCNRDVLNFNLRKI